MARLVRLVVLLVASVVVSGCDLVLSLDRDAPDASLAPDGPTIDPSPDAAICDVGQPTLGVLPAMADVAISSGSPNQAAGTLDVVTIATDLGPQGSAGLFRFELGSIDPASVRELRLVLPSAQTANACDGGCGACPQFEVAGTLHAYPVVDTWVETETTWNAANATQSWQVAGAAGPNDRGTNLGAAASHAVGEDTTFVVDPQVLPAVLAWRAGNRLSFVVDSEGAKQVTRTNDNTCDGSAPAAHLEVVSCR